MRERLRKIGLADRDHPITEMIARQIVECPDRCPRPAALSLIAIKEMGLA
jgi:hypothetical protein